MFNFYDPYRQPYSVPVQRSEVVKVNGRAGAEAFAMAANSSALLLDTTAPMVWLKTTDGAGYPTVTGFDIVPHEEPKQVDLNSIEERLKRLEERYGQSDFEQAATASTD